MNELALFAGAGGGILGGTLIGFRTVCAVEIEPYAASVLVARQNDRILPPFPIWDDVRTFDGKPWRGIVDVVSGGFPCQDISVCKKNAKGIDGERSGLWKEMARIICDVRPRFVFVENSPALLIRGFERVLGDLASMGYNARWGVLGAGAIGSVCEGERIWILASETNSTVLEGVDIPEYIVPCSEESRRWQYSRAIGAMLSQDDYSIIKRDTHVMAGAMDRLKAIGNGQVPAVAAKAWHVLFQKPRAAARHRGNLPYIMRSNNQIKGTL
jgi:DNA (cytosine-5)-methyltransferase 1